MLRTVFLVTLLLTATMATADVYKCPDEKGSTVFRDMPCAGMPVAAFTTPALPLAIPPEARLSFAQYPRLVEGVRALRKVRTATEIGISRMDYARQLIEVKAIIDESARVPMDTTGQELQSALVSILQVYLDALTVWRMSTERLSIDLEEATRFTRAYNILRRGIVTQEGDMLRTVWAVGRYKLGLLDQMVQ